MHTYAKQQLPAQRKENHGTAAIHDLSLESKALQRKADLIGRGAVIQKKPARGGIQVDDIKMAADLLHDERANLFTPESITYRNANPPSQIRGWNVSAKVVEHWLINGNRNHIKYQQYAESLPLTSKAQLTAWLNTPGNEHMYVHDKDTDTIYAATRNDEKRPHPTLVGGDPIVKGAGTMYKHNDTVYITKVSGHFRPRFIHNDTIDKVSRFGVATALDIRV